MITLRLLGGASLQGPDGPLAGPMTQHRRLAILAVLATAGERPVSRATLVGLLWPDSPEDKARHLLSTGLSVLRRALGPEAITGSGEDLRLNFQRVWADVTAFEDALDRDALQKAAELYEGAFLKGFYVDDARTFERWADEQRRRLADAYARALEGLAGRAEETARRTEAVRWWKRLAAHDPYNSRYAAGLMRALARAGDPTNAVVHAREHEEFIKEELGASPTPEVIALAKRLRQSPADFLSDAETEPRAKPSIESQDTTAEDSAGTGSGVEPRPEPANSRSGRIRSYVGTLVALIVAGTLVYAASVFFFTGPADGPTAGEIRSLAVLPLQNLSEDPEQEYFAAGMHEALVTEIGQIGALSVISRTSVMQYAGTAKTPSEIATELDVDVLVEGSVLQVEDEVRITLQLVDGPTARQLWARSYRRHLRDVLALQGEVARDIAREIRISVAAQEEARLAAAETVDPSAYEAYLKGRYHYARVSTEDHLSALSHYRNAVSLDPGFAEAYAALAQVCSHPTLLTEVRATSLDDCASWARKAVELDGKLAEAHAALGRVERTMWNWEASEAHLRRAIQLNPNSVMARQEYSNLLRENLRLEEALEQARLAEELDPLNLFVKTMVGWPLWGLHRYEQALAQFDEVLDMDPDYGLALYNQGLVYWTMGKPEEVLDRARRAARRLGEDTPIIRLLTAAGHGLANREERALAMLRSVEEEHGDHFQGFIAGVYVTLGRERDALSWIERGYQQRSPLLPHQISEPPLEALRSDPRFRNVLQKMGLLRRWRPNVAQSDRMADSFQVRYGMYPHLQTEDPDARIRREPLVPSRRDDLDAITQSGSPNSNREPSQPNRR